MEAPIWFDAAAQGLHRQLSQWVDLPPGEWRYLIERAQAASIPRGGVLLRAGEPPRWIDYLHSGLVRLYYLTGDGKTSIKGFGRPGELVAALADIIQERPASFFIEALEPLCVLRIDSRRLEALFARHRCWERLGRRLAEQALIRKERREEEFLLCDARERYRRFLDRYGDLIGRIPQRHIASYIGITEVALSRMLRSGRAS